MIDLKSMCLRICQPMLLMTLLIACITCIFSALNAEASTMVKAKVASPIIISVASTPSGETYLTETRLELKEGKRPNSAISSKGTIRYLQSCLLDATKVIEHDRRYLVVKNGRWLLKSVPGTTIIKDQVVYSTSSRHCHLTDTSFGRAASLVEERLNQRVKLQLTANSVRCAGFFSALPLEPCSMYS